MFQDIDCDGIDGNLSRSVFVTGDVGDDLTMFAFDLAGKPVWRSKNGRSWKGPYPGARASCTYSDGHLFHMNAHGRAACLDAATGEETLVRGVELVGTPLASVNRILSTGDTPRVFNGFCGAESGYVPTATVAPAVLVGELELQRVAKALELLKAELDISMALCGVKNARDIGPEHVLVPEDFEGKWA